MLLAGLLELSRELAAAIDLQGADREGHAVRQSIEDWAALWAVARV